MVAPDYPETRFPNLYVAAGWAPHERLTLVIVKLGRVSRRLAADQPVRAAGVEAQHPIANNLTADATDLGRLGPAPAVIDHRQRQKLTCLVFYENPDALDPHRRDMLATWLGNRRHGRDGVAAGRTLAAAMAEVEKAAAAVPDRAAEVKAIRRWLGDEGGT